MKYFSSSQKQLVFLNKFFKNDFILSFTIIFVIFNIVLYFFSPVLKSENYELVDITFSVFVLFLTFLYSYIVILYNNSYNYLFSLIEKESQLFSLDSFYVKKSNFDFIKDEFKNWKYINLLYLTVPVLYVIIGFFNTELGEINGNDIGYFIGLLVFIALFNSMFSSIPKDIEYIIHDKIISTKNTEKKGIESYIIEIHEHLKIFNPTSAFRQRVEGALSSIKEIFIINIESLNRLKNDAELSEKINQKNALIEAELRKMLFSIIDYNNERNETILESIEHNIKIINSLRN